MVEKFNEKDSKKSHFHNQMEFRNRSIKESAEKSGRYGKQAKEVAARTVMKHHKEEVHQKDH